MFEDVTYPVALLAGLLSFFSPCVLPLIPSYFCFITGMSLEDLTAAPKATIRRKIVMSTFAFVLGFSVVFIILGASVSFLGGLVSQHKGILRIIGGALIIVFGLHLTGIVRIPFLQYEKRLHLHKKPLHFLGTFIIGMAFGAGWTPCIGPILGSLLIMAQDKETVEQGVWLLCTYSVGLALPFMLLSVFISYLLAFTRKASKVLRYANQVAGILLIATGVLLVTDKLSMLVVY